MIGMAKSVKGGNALANYIMQENKGYELDRNGLSGISPKEIMDEMKIIQSLNQRAVNKTLSLVLSPEIKESKELTDGQLKTIVKDFLKELDINPNEQQYLAFVHDEKKHKHIHILVNRVKEDGNLIADNFIGKKAQWGAHNVAKAHGLISAKEIMIQNIKGNKVDTELRNTVKREIYNKHQFVIEQKPRSFEEYKQKMEELDLEILPTINKQGKTQGYRIVDLATGESFKASEVHRSMGLNRLKDAIKILTYDNHYTGSNANRHYKKNKKRRKSRGRGI